MNKATRVVSTDTLYHYFLNPDDALVSSILENGLRPLSDFPDSERWRELEAQMPGFYERLYQMIGQPVLGRPYHNSGVFLTPIDFRRMPDHFMARLDRIRVPLQRLDRSSSALTYVVDEQRLSLPLSQQTLREAAVIWTAQMVREWFARDRSKIFFYVPQVAAYQAGGIPVSPEEVERAP